MTTKNYIIPNNIEITNVEESNLVIGKKKIILQDKMDIFIPSIVKNDTGIIVVDASMDVNLMYTDAFRKN